MALGRLPLAWRDADHTQKGMVAMIGSEVHGGYFQNPTASTGGFIRFEFAGIVYGTCIQCLTVAADRWRTAAGTGSATVDLQSAGCSAVITTVSGITVTAYSDAACTVVALDPTTTEAAFTTLPSASGETGLVIRLHQFTSASRNHIIFEARIPACDFEEGGVFNNEVTAHGCFTSYDGRVYTAIGHSGTVTLSRVCL